LVVSVTCFLSLGLILFCGCIDFLAKCVCAISVHDLGVIHYELIHNNKTNNNKNLKEVNGERWTKKQETKQKNKQ
jgi:hypothetical protein